MKFGGRIEPGALCLVLLMAVGCGGDPPSESGVQQQVYFDPELNRPVIAEAGLETPAVNPDTGHQTLIPALYCPKCQTWRAAPPLWVVERTPESRRCDECRGALESDGPLPTELP